MQVEEEVSEAVTMVLPSPKPVPEDAKKKAELEKKEKEKADQVRSLLDGATAHMLLVGGQEEGRVGEEGEGEG